MRILPAGALFGAVTLAALPAIADPSAKSLEDGRVHGFTGCLRQAESDGVRYFHLTNAKSDDGTAMGTLRLTSTLTGIAPRESVGQRVHVEGLYVDHSSTASTDGRVAVKYASSTEEQCA